VTDIPHVDVNVFLPAALRAEAELRAIEINPANMPKPTPPDAPPQGDPVVKQRVMAFANQWTEHANLEFDFGDHAEAEIRITFDPNLGSWSRIGTDATLFPQSQPTMNFGWLQPTTADQTYSAVVLHEFGHAIGCIHEHQSPSGGIQWNKPVVYAYYKRLGWTKADVDYNLFYAFDQDSTNHVSASETFDPQSIMIYPILKEHTTNGYEVPWRTQLSALDKQFIAQVYPKG
jgi:serralysin